MSNNRKRNWIIFLLIVLAVAVLGAVIIGYTVGLEQGRNEVAQRDTGDIAWACNVTGLPDSMVYIFRAWAVNDWVATENTTEYGFTFSTGGNFSYCENNTEAK